MKNLLLTDPNNLAAFAARMALGIVVFPHGAQKLFGWWGGYGLTGTLHYLTGWAGIPWIFALLVILIESVGSLMIFFGFCTRFAAFATLCNFVGVMFHSHAKNGFFMNWLHSQDRGEGMEFFFLLIGLAIVLIITGGGKWSVDAALTRKKIVVDEREIEPVLENV